MDKYRFPDLKKLGRTPINPTIKYEKTGVEDTNIVEAPQFHGTYGELLFDERWRKKREQILVRDGRRCIICFNTSELQVHHRQYHFVQAAQKFKVPWDYDNSLLVTLCKSCHSRGHNKFKVPTLTV